jgi:hypothetical protein
MINSEFPSGLQAKDFTDQRNDALREGVKGLFLMNGGGAVAMLAFLQAIWKDNPQLAKYVITSIALLAVGVFLGGLVQFLDTALHLASKAGSTMHLSFIGFFISPRLIVHLLLFSSAS